VGLAPVRGFDFLYLEVGYVPPAPILIASSWLQRTLVDPQWWRGRFHAELDFKVLDIHLFLPPRQPARAKPRAQTKNGLVYKGGVILDSPVFHLSYTKANIYTVN